MCDSGSQQPNKSARSLLPYLLAAALFGTWLLSACQGSGAAPVGEESVTSTDGPVTTESAATLTGASDTVDPGEDRQLVIWAPDFFSRDREASSDRVMDAAFAQFEQRHPSTRIEVQPKALAGETSVFAYLRSAQRVAPDILPDIVLLNASELWQAAELGLISTLTSDDVAGMAEFYPFAIQAVAYNGEIWGVPYVSDLLHAIDQHAATDATPLTWADLLASDSTYLFPAGSRDGYANDSVLLQYVGAGGQLLEDGTVSNPDAMEAVFEFYLRGIQQGNIPAEIEQYAGLNSVWQAFGDGRADMADTSSTLLLSQGDPVAEMAYTPAPTLTGEPVTLANTWAFAILTTDPEQRVLAIDLLATVLDPAVHGAWSQFVHRLPTQRAALEEWTSGSDYFAYLRDRMVPVAISAPNGRLYEEFTVRLQDALRGILNGSLTPAEAVLEVRAGP